MNTNTKISTRKRGGVVEVLVAIRHPMTPGRPKDPNTGAPMKANFIETVKFSLNDKPVAEAKLGLGVAKDPVISIALPDAHSGDKVTAAWIDTENQRGTASASIA